MKKPSVLGMALVGFWTSCAVSGPPVLHPFEPEGSPFSAHHAVRDGRPAGETLFPVVSLNAEAHPGWELGYHAGVWLGDGEPANDTPVVASLFARRKLDEDWWLRLGIEVASGDFETPHELLGIIQDPGESDIDSTADHLALFGWADRVYPTSEKSEWFWQVGAGVNFVDVDDVDGSVMGGGSFDIETDAGTEIIGSIGGGYRRLFDRWRLEGLIRYDYHLAEWELTDRISGATDEVDDYSTWALLLGFSYGL